MGDLWDTPDIVPMLVYEDLPSAVDWLARAFGFRERSEAPLSWATGAMTWMEIGGGLINISAGGAQDQRNPANAEAANLILKVYVDDLDAHFQRATATGATIISEPQDGFWGGRAYRAKDLAGYQWEFSQCGVDLPAKDWRLPPGMTRGAQ